MVALTAGADVNLFHIPLGGSLTTSNWNPTSYTGNNVLGGANDDTAALQQQLNSGGFIIFPPTNFTTSPLQLTNNTTILGIGSVFNLKAGSGNTSIFNLPANPSNIVILGPTAIDWENGVFQTNTLSLFTSPLNLANPTLVSTNFTMVIHVTNDVNGNTALEFTGISNGVGQIQNIMFSQTPGGEEYGAIGVTPNHAGGGHNSPQNSEMGFGSSGSMAFIPGDSPTGNQASHVQWGGPGIGAVRMYMNPNSIPSSGNTAPSDIFEAITEWLSNSTPYLFDPGWRARISQTANASNAMVWQYSMFPSTQGLGDNWTDAALSQALNVYFGTNGAQNYIQATELFGEIASVQTNKFLLDTNNIKVWGSIVDEAPTVDSWTMPDNFSTPNGAFNMSTIGPDLFLETSANGALVVGDGTGTINTTHSYFWSGPSLSGSGFPLGTVTMGTNGNAPSGIELYVKGNGAFTGTLTLQTTNAPPVNTTTPKTWIPVTNNGIMYEIPGYQ